MENQSIAHTRWNCTYHIVFEEAFIIGAYDENGVTHAMNAAWRAQSDFDEIRLFFLDVV